MERRQSIRYGPACPGISHPYRRAGRLSLLP